MRVLMTTDTIGGVWTYCLELARALQPLRVEFILATMGQLPTDDQRAEAGAIPNIQLHESTFKLEWMANPWDDVARAGDRLLELERQFQPDIVHLNGYAHAACAFHAPRIVVGHSCVLSWWRAVKKGDSPALSQSSICSHSSAMFCTSTRSIISFFCRPGVRERSALPRFRLIMLCVVSLWLR